MPDFRGATPIYTHLMSLLSLYSWKTQVSVCLALKVLLLCVELASVQGCWFKKMAGFFETIRLGHIQSIWIIRLDKWEPWVRGLSWRVTRYSPAPAIIWPKLLMENKICFLSNVSPTHANWNIQSRMWNYIHALMVSILPQYAHEGGFSVAEFHCCTGRKLACQKRLPKFRKVWCEDIEKQQQSPPSRHSPMLELCGGAHVCPNTWIDWIKAVSTAVRARVPIPQPDVPFCFPNPVFLHSWVSERQIYYYRVSNVPRFVTLGHVLFYFFKRLFRLLPVGQIATSQFSYSYNQLPHISCLLEINQGRSEGRRLY